MDRSITVKPVVIAEYTNVISGMMHHLHLHERNLFDKTAAWSDIEENYMRHIILMQDEYEGTCLLAFVGEEPVGFIFGYVEDQDDSRIEVYMGRELYVSDGYVADEHRCKGIYRLLNKELERIYIEKGVKRICRYALVNNTKARSFLDSEGYVVTRLLHEKWLD